MTQRFVVWCKELRAFAIALAGVTLDPVTMNRIVEEAEMTVDEYVAKTLWHGSYGEKLRQQLRERALQEGRQEGRLEGRQEGAAQGRERLLVVLMHERFGPHPDAPAIARQLTAHLDDVEAVHAVSSAVDLADLVASALPSP
jgi:predicted transposase YdaD